MQWVLFSIYDYHFYGYCFDRADCLAENAANLTALQSFFHSHIDKFSYEVPSNVCSCIPGWLWLVLTVTQFLSHHLGTCNLTIFNYLNNILYHLPIII